MPVKTDITQQVTGLKLGNLRLGDNPVMKLFLSLPPEQLVFVDSSGNKLDQKDLLSMIQKSQENRSKEGDNLIVKLSNNQNYINAKSRWEPGYSAIRVNVDKIKQGNNFDDCIEGGPRSEKTILASKPANNTTPYPGAGINGKTIENLNNRGKVYHSPSMAEAATADPLLDNIGTSDLLTMFSQIITKESKQGYINESEIADFVNALDGTELRSA